MGMKRFFRYLMVAGLMACGGCKTPWALGSVTECLPRHVEKCRPDTAFFVEKNPKRAKFVLSAIESALRNRGFEVVSKAAESGVLVRVTVDAWEYNDAGFSGFGERNDMILTIALVDRRKGTVTGRWRVEVKSDLRILARCVDKF